MATPMQTVATPIQTSNYHVFGPFRTPSNDARYVYTKAPILVTPLQADRTLGVQGTMQSRVAEEAPGLVQQSEEVQYVDGRGRQKTTRNYIASSYLQMASAVMSQFDKASRGKGSFPARYELSPRKKEGSPPDESIAVAVLDIDGDVEANPALLRAMRKRRYKAKTPMFDACMEVHPAEALASLRVKREIQFHKEMIEIMKLVVEAFLQTLSRELASCPEFEEFEFNPRIFSSCKDSKISFHAIIRVYVVDQQGNRAEVVFGSIEDLKPLYKMYVSEYFGEPHHAEMEHPFLTEPDETWTEEQIEAHNRSVALLLKNNKVPTVECAGDISIGTGNRIVRGALCTKIGREIAKLFFLLGDDGEWYTCHLFDNNPEGELTTAIYDEDGPYWGDLSFMRHYLLGSVLYMAPEKPHYILSASSKNAIKKRARVSARKARTHSTSFEITIPENYEPFDKSFDLETFCNDSASAIIDYYNTTHKCKPVITKFKVSADAQLIKVEMRTAGIVPCAINNNTTHSSNNFYLLISKNYEAWRVSQKCYSVPCKRKSKRGTFMEAISTDLVFDDYVDTTEKHNLEELFGVPWQDEDDDMSNFSEYIKAQASHIDREDARCRAEKEIEPEAPQVVSMKRKSQSGGKQNVMAAIADELRFLGVE